MRSSPIAEPKEPWVMQVDVEVSAVIHRPVAEVAAYAADPANAPEWYANIQSVTFHETGRAEVGSKLDFVAQFLGRRLAYTYEITELVPGQRLVMRTADGPFPMETTYTWSPEGDATRMRLRNAGSPTGFASLGAPVMQRAMKAATSKDLRRLKGILESRRQPRIVAGGIPSDGP